MMIMTIIMNFITMITEKTALNGKEGIMLVMDTWEICSASHIIWNTMHYIKFMLLNIY